jgi:hypothetical protein
MTDTSFNTDNIIICTIKKKKSITVGTVEKKEIFKHEIILSGELEIDIPIENVLVQMRDSTTMSLREFISRRNSKADTKNMPIYFDSDKPYLYMSIQNIVTYLTKDLNPKWMCTKTGSVDEVPTNIPKKLIMYVPLKDKLIMDYVWAQFALKKKLTNGINHKSCREKFQTLTGAGLFELKMDFSSFSGQNMYIECFDSNEDGIKQTGTGSVPRFEKISKELPNITGLTVKYSTLNIMEIGENFYFGISPTIICLKKNSNGALSIYSEAKSNSYEYRPSLNTLDKLKNNYKGYIKTIKKDVPDYRLSQTITI